MTQFFMRDSNIHFLLLNQFELPTLQQNIHLSFTTLHVLHALWNANSQVAAVNYPLVEHSYYILVLS